MNYGHANNIWDRRFFKVYNSLNDKKHLRDGKSKECKIRFLVSENKNYKKWRGDPRCRYSYDTNKDWIEYRINCFINNCKKIHHNIISKVYSPRNNFNNTNFNPKYYTKKQFKEIKELLMARNIKFKISNKGIITISMSENIHLL